MVSEVRRIDMPRCYRPGDGIRNISMALQEYDRLFAESGVAMEERNPEAFEKLQDCASGSTIENKVYDFYNVKEMGFLSEKQPLKANGQKLGASPGELIDLLQGAWEGIEIPSPGLYNFKELELDFDMDLLKYEKVRDDLSSPAVRGTNSFTSGSVLSGSAGVSYLALSLMMGGIGDPVSSALGIAGAAASFYFSFIEPGISGRKYRGNIFPSNMEFEKLLFTAERVDICLGGVGDE